MYLTLKILIGEDLISLLNVLSGKEREQIQQSINHAIKHDGSIFIFSPIAEKMGRLSFFSLLYCADENHAFMGVIFESQNTQEGKADLEKTWQLLVTQSPKNRADLDDILNLVKAEGENLFK
jgi:predicted lactoylglutathione lyase